MPFFPQLSTGSSAHYPLLKVRRTRTVENHAPDGSRWRLGDPDAASVRWEMRYSGLSDEEWLTLKSFFELCEGRLRTFTFLDPTDNLLSASEDLEAEEWSNSPLIQLAAGVPDPDGASRATRLTNAAQVDQSVQQVLSVSAQQHYCFSFYGRATAATFAALRQTAGAATVSFDLINSLNYDGVATQSEADNRTAGQNIWQSYGDHQVWSGNRIFGRVQTTEI